MQRSLRTIFLLFSSVFCVACFLPSCKVAKSLPEGQSLLVKNKIVILTNVKSAEKNKMKADLPNIASQKPNIRLFGFWPLRMDLYHSAKTSAAKHKLTKFKQWIMDKVGEAPVIYDTLGVDKSRGQMENYLFNFGFLYAKVSDTVVTKNKKTTITFFVNPGTRWKVGEIELPKAHTNCDSIVRERRENTFLHKGEGFDVTNLKNERERIETILRNSGYFTFSREYVAFDLDTISDEKLVNIKIKILPPNDMPEHQQYWLNNIYVITDYSIEGVGDSAKRDTITSGEYKILYRKMKFRTKVLLNAIFLKKDSLYSKEDELRTINHLSQLGTFKFISLDYSKAKDRNGNYLDCVIQLTPGKKQSWTGNLEVNVSDEGLFGTAGSLTYVNKNLTKGADQLIINGSSGVQVRFSKPQGEKAKVQLMDVNTSIGLTYYLNKFLIPFRAKIFSPNANPKTRVSVSYTFDHRYDFDILGNVVFLYQLHNFNASFGYEWNKGTSQHHLLNPVAVDFYLLPKTGDEFTRRLNQNPLLKSSFQEQIIIGPNYTFTYNNQKSNADRKYMYLRVSAETAGNLMDGLFKAASTKDANDSSFLIAGQPFAQFFRLEADWRNFIHINNHSLFAIRTYGGIGVPYGNSVALPFIKQFYAGGPNSLRGFSIREIGPGGYVDTLVYNPASGPKKTAVGFFDQTGDIKLEANAEIRFDIYRWLKGAVFADAGNVWTLRKDAALPNGNFDISTFLSQIAVDAGAGIRLDFNYFVVRFDYGFPLRDPRRLQGERWQFKNGTAFKNGQLQLAIGYPF